MARHENGCLAMMNNLPDRAGRFFFNNVQILYNLGVQVLETYPERSTAIIAAKGDYNIYSGG
jgi:predicted nuclease with RNAse H fold